MWFNCVRVSLNEKASLDLGTYSIDMDCFLSDLIRCAQEQYEEARGGDFTVNDEIR
jgi:hypothetical protein